jgi:hypothetical protein
MEAQTLNRAKFLGDAAGCLSRSRPVCTHFLVQNAAVGESRIDAGRQQFDPWAEKVFQWMENGGWAARWWWRKTGNWTDCSATLRSIKFQQPIERQILKVTCTCKISARSIILVACRSNIVMQTWDCHHAILSVHS